MGWSLAGTAVGLALLLPAYAIGGMGAGDVKLLAGVGAWVGVTITLYAFCVSAIVGGVIAVLMVLYRRAWTQALSPVLDDLARSGSRFAIPSNSPTIAAERKSSMMLLPYGIPIAIGTIAYFAYDRNAALGVRRTLHADQADCVRATHAVPVIRTP